MSALQGRRGFLIGLAAWAAAPRPVVGAEALAPPLIAVRDTLAQWDALGWQWTGSDAELAGATWLGKRASALGLDVTIERFDFERVDVNQCHVAIGDQHRAGLPLFDSGVTPATGITAVLGAPVPPGQASVTGAPKPPANPPANPSSAPGGAAAGASGRIALLELGPLDLQHPALEAARKDPSISAVIVITEGARGSLAPLDAPDPRHSKPQSKPVIQIAREDADWLRQAAARGASATVVSRFDRTPAQGRNVVARFTGTDPALPPTVVVAGRTGWGPCVGERAGGLVTWLTIAEALYSQARNRSAILVATSGCELGNMGRTAFLEHRRDLPASCHAWIELGPDLGARGSSVAIAGPAKEWVQLCARRLFLEQPSIQAIVTELPPSPVRLKQELALTGSAAPLDHSSYDQLPAAVDLPRVLSIARGAARAAVEISQP